MLIKPASGNCNLRCRYCFYCDEMEKRTQGNLGIMSMETLEIVVRKALQYANADTVLHSDGSRISGYERKSVSFAFQGGEPTLAGLSFYERLIELEQQYNTGGAVITHAIQTNAYALNENWAAFFAEHHFLTGVSIDGVIHTHDRYRKTPSGDGSFRAVMQNIELLRKYNVEFNILTVVNKDTAMRIRKIYEFYRKQDFRYLQFIPCLDPLGEPEGQREYSLTPVLYGQFLCDLFDLWYQDLQKGCQPYIREFENYVGILLGHSPEACSMRGTCSMQFVTEADGSVYPCDFYVLDRYRLGSLEQEDIPTLLEKGLRCGFIEESLQGKEDCAHCEYEFLCRGGCRRHRVSDEEGTLGRNIFCGAYRRFFREKLLLLRRIAAGISGRSGV